MYVAFISLLSFTWLSNLRVNNNNKSYWTCVEWFLCLTESLCSGTLICRWIKLKLDTLWLCDLIHVVMCSNSRHCCSFPAKHAALQEFRISLCGRSLAQAQVARQRSIGFTPSSFRCLFSLLQTAQLLISKKIRDHALAVLKYGVVALMCSRWVAWRSDYKVTAGVWLKTLKCKK